MSEEPRLGRVKLSPPKPGTCKECAVEHDPAMPHHRDSLYYQMRFYQKYRRFPTWSDAMAHCSREVRTKWREELKKKGVSIGPMEAHGE